jgi:acyl transferase domain-containing protein/NADP-dependent 3-hydroxy acid dehydrogenase YdfG/acyl carrier protein
MGKNDVAIIGISCIFPGSDSYEQYWDNLKNGKCSVAEIGKDRWDVNEFYSPEFTDKNKACSKWCGMIKNVYDFDNAAFFISRREAEKMDPQQRLLLQETWHCIEDSGVSFKKLKEMMTSVFVGAMNCDYRQELYSGNAIVDGYSTLGSFENMLANRISHCFSLNGASTTLNAACASSLVAIDYAVDSLANGNSDYAIAAGANLNLNPWKYLSFSKARMLSPNGLCKTFDATADGYVPGDGIAVLLLQRLELAERQGNKIYGVIKSVSVGHNGGALTITAPRIESQVKVISAAYKKAYISPDEISYVETHGTGTSLGDPIEISALKQVFQKQSKRKDKCYVGSVKSNIGHLESASGMAGVIKVLMMMKYHQIPRTINTNGNNEIINLNDTPFELNNQVINWEPKQGKPLRAGISSFGFGGTNAHIILEEYVDKRKSKLDKDSQLLVLSANSLEVAEHIKEDWNKKIADYSKDDYSDILKTAFNEDRNHQFRYARILSYGELPKIDRDIQFISTKKNKPKIIVINELTKEKYAEYRTLKNKYYRYSEILDELLNIAKKHKVSIDLDEDVDKISEENYRVNLFTVEYAFAEFLKEIGISFNYMSWDKKGLTAMLALVNIYDYEDIILYLTGKKELREIGKNRQNGILINANDGVKIYPFELCDISDNINKFIELPLSSRDEKLLEKFRMQFELLINNQYTFRNNISEWDSSLNLLTSCTELWRKKYTLIALFDSLRRLKDKWGIEMEEDIESPEIRYFIDVISNHVISIEEFSNMIYNGNTLYTEELEQRAENYLIENGSFKVLTSCHNWDKASLEKLENTEYTNKDDGSNCVYLSEFVTDFQENLIQAWLNGADISFDKLFNEEDYQKKSVKKSYFVKNSFAKPGMQDMIHVYRPDDVLIKDHNILGKTLVPGAELICKIMEDYHLENMDNILFRQAALIDGKKEYSYKNDKNENYQIIDLLNNNVIFSCSQINKKTDEIIELNEEIVTKNTKMHFYNILKKAGYNYGDSLQLISELGESGSYYIFKLKASAETENTEILDNAFQCAIILAGVTQPDFSENTYFPYCIDHLECYQKLYGDVEVYISKDTYNATSKIISADILIVRDKTIIMKISHMILNASKKLENTHFTYKLEWIDTATKDEPLPEHIVVMGNWSAEKELLLECCKGTKVMFIEKSQEMNGLTERSAEGTKFYWFCDGAINADEEPDVYYQDSIYPFLLFAKEIAKAEKKITVSLVCSGELPYDATLKGILKALKRENININTGIYNVNDFNKDSMHRLLHDIPADDECEISIGKQRSKRMMVPMQTVNDGNNFIVENGIYIIIGGTGGVGREIGKLLAEKKNATIVLTGRNSKSNYIDEIISYVSQDTGKSVYYSTDVCDKYKMQHLIVQVKERFGRVDGIIHSAVDMVDAELKHITSDMFLQGLKCKYYGAVILADICLNNNIRNVLFFSSILTYTGNKGQAGYIAGCNFLDEYAHYLNTKGLNAKVLNWGYWAETGVAKNEHFGTILKRLGVGKMKTSEGLDQFLNAMDSNENQIFIVKMEENDAEAEEVKNGVDTIQVKENNVVTSTLVKEADGVDLVKNIIEDIREIVQNITHNVNVSVKTPFLEIGIESIIGVELVNEISGLYSIQLSQTIIFDYPTIKKLSEAIYKRYKEAIELHYEQSDSVDQNADESIEEVREESEQDSKTVRKDVAIVGISCRLGSTDNTEELWKALVAGQNLVTEIPEERWKLEGFYDPDRNNKKTSYCKWGSFISDVYDFEPSFFKISPKEAKYMDPQQRVLLEESYKALEDAGYTYEMLDELECGAIYGIMNNDHRENLGSKAENVDYGLLLSGNSNAILSARISYLLNLKGPAFTLDTACSSSLVAMYLGCQAIQNGDANMMIIGGTTLFLAPEYYIQMCGLSMLSPRGMCSTFDQKADGFVPGEGVGVVILKSLDKAREDHDNIYGIIKGSGYNQDGATNGITSPSKESQRQLELNVYRRTGINPETISMVEAHGTGTKLGDPIEVEALKECYGEFTEKKNYCAIGSLKTYSGHTLAAAGVSSVIKVLLCMQHKQLVPSLHYETQNEFIDFENSPFYMPKKLQDWDVTGIGKRRAAISSFGFSGTNVHMIIEEPAENKKQSVRHEHYFLPISAKTDQSLKKIIKQLILWLETYGTDDILDDLQYTLIMRRNHFECRCAVIVDSVENAIAELNKIRDNLDSNRINIDNADILSDAQFTDTISRNYLSEDDIRKIFETSAVQYINGDEIDWTNYYDKRENVCLSIPTYSFNRQTCRADFQLQRNNVKHNEFGDYDFYRDYTFLKDHMVNGQYVVPAAFIMKMVVDKYKLTEKKKTSCLKDVFFDQRILFSESVVKVNFESANTYKQFTIEDKNHKIYCRGKCLNNREENFSNMKIQDLEGENVWDEEGCYEILDDLGLHYQNGFRCIKKVKIEGRYLTGMLKAKENLETYIVDGALQAAALMVKSLNVFTSSAIPVSVYKIQYLKSIEEESYIKIENYVCDIDSSFDVFILNKCGEVCVFMENVIIHTNRKELDEMKMLRVLENVYEGSEDIDDVMRNI